MRASLLMLVVLGGCFGGTEATPFPPGLEPLEPIRAEPPTAPGTINFVTGEGDYDWAHGSALIDAPLAEVAAALADPTLIRDPSVASYTVEWDVEPEYETSFVLHYTDTRVVTVTFDVTWREGVVSGTPAAPDIVAARFQKTAGTTFISLMEGSIVARADGQRTRLELIEHLSALTSGSAECQAYLQAIFDQVNGAVVP